MVGKHTRTTVLVEDNSLKGELDIHLNNSLLKEILPVMERIGKIKKSVKEFYFEVVLSTVNCTICGGRLKMIGQSECMCSCGNVLDPTIEFQLSPCCSVRLVHKTYHYVCSCCNNSVPSRFLFDERLFDAQYFRERMQESRQRKKIKREAVRRLLTESRSNVLVFMEEPELESVPGLLYDLDEFVENTNSDFEIAEPGHGNIFNIEKYHSHIRSVLTWNPIHFSEIAPLEDSYRRDRAYRFITLIYMENDHEIQIKQHGDDLFLQRIYHEAHIKG